MCRFVVPVVGFVLLGSHACAISAEKNPALPVVWEVSEGIRAPESVCWDKGSGLLFVSNIGEGAPAAGPGGGGRNDGA